MTGTQALSFVLVLVLDFLKHFEDENENEEEFRFIPAVCAESTEPWQIAF